MSDETKLAQDSFSMSTMTDNIEAHYVNLSVTPICGLDEAGRGPLAGPVVASAVIYKDCESLRAASDSKALSKKRREQLYEELIQDVVHGVGVCSPEEIDRINILQASLLAMRRAVSKLCIKPKVVLVDGIHSPYSEREFIVHTIPKGDALVKVIGAASIIAKVHRDCIMSEYDEQYPGYGFKQHAGYPTRSHLQALLKLGPCPIHRRSFKGVREFFQ